MEILHIFHVLVINMHIYIYIDVVMTYVIMITLYCTSMVMQI